MPLEAGMAVGFFLMAILVGIGVESIGKNTQIISIFQDCGSIYMIYLAIKIAKSPPIVSDDHKSIEDHPLGPIAGLLLQPVNPKSWVYFTILMTVYAPRIGDEFSVIILLAVTTTIVGVGSILFWSGAGAILRSVFSEPKSAARVNLALGLILALVAIDIVFHSQLISLIG